MANDSAVSKAYEYLYNQILDGNLALGAPIAEAEVSREIGLSRSPIREALKRMEAEGLVKHYQGRGVFVTDITQHDLEEIFELRIVLETTALHTSINRIGEEKLDEMEQSFLALKDNGGTEEEFYAANSDLHDTIVNYCGNQRLRSFLSTLDAQNAIVNRISSIDPRHFSTSTVEHLDIIRAIRERDPEKAEACLRKHIETVRSSTIESYLYRRR